VVKAIWLPMAFVVGIALGWFLAHRDSGAPALQPEMVDAAANSPPARVSDSTPVAAPPATPPARHPQTAAPTTGLETANSPTAAPEPAAQDASEPSQPIDVGPVFRKQFEENTKQGYRDVMAESHRALEREVRDDSWAYPMEADIENSLVVDTSMGNFRREHLECRATMCELRLSARGEAQSAALQKWNDGLRQQPWSGKVSMSSSSTSNVNGNTDALMIFVRAPAPAPKKN